MERKGILVAFSIKAGMIKTGSEKSKFFKALYGWTQTVPKEKKTYSYYREGVLDEMPHVRVDQSSFIVPQENFDDIMDFFGEWTNKVMLKTFQVLLDDETKDIFDEFQLEEDG